MWSFDARATLKPLYSTTACVVKWRHRAMVRTLWPMDQAPGRMPHFPARELHSPVSRRRVQSHGLSCGKVMSRTMLRLEAVVTGGHSTGTISQADLPSSRLEVLAPGHPAHTLDEIERLCCPTTYAIQPPKAYRGSRFAGLVCRKS